MDETIYLPGGVQWDGKYLAVGDQVAVKHNFTSTIYQFSISGSIGTTVNTMVLTGSSEVAQFWLPRVDSGPRHRSATQLIGPNQNGGDTLILGLSIRRQSDQEHFRRERSDRRNGQPRKVARDATRWP